MTTLRTAGARWLLPLALLALSVIWGYSWVLAKQALVSAPPLAFAAERCFAGGIALLLVVTLTGQPLKIEAPGSTILIGLFQVSGFMGLQNWALTEGGPGKTAVLIFTMPLWTLLIARIFLKERIHGKQWLAAGSTLAGLILIIAPWKIHTSIFSEILGIGAALCWAIGTVLVKRLRLRQPINLLRMTGWQLLTGSLPLILLATCVPERATQWSLSYISILTFMTLISTALGWWLWINILDRVPAWEASLSVLGTPVVAIISSRLLTSEPFDLYEINGILLIASGLVLLSLFSRTSK